MDEERNNEPKRMKLKDKFINLTEIKTTTNWKITENYKRRMKN